LRERIFGSSRRGNYSFVTADDEGFPNCDLSLPIAVRLTERDKFNGTFFKKTYHFRSNHLDTRDAAFKDMHLFMFADSRARPVRCCETHRGDISSWMLEGCAK